LYRAHYILVAPKIQYDKKKGKEKSELVCSKGPLKVTQRLPLTSEDLNREKRKQEQQRATQGNPAILGRVTKPEPRCQAQRWHEDWQRAEKHTFLWFQEKTIQPDSQALDLSSNNKLHPNCW
uniref:Uncharacterized protein n=1 Tax=Anas platyrhynchos platyrhynchos TaxID=8840 RepID=A0A493T545_ANAPP